MKKPALTLAICLLSLPGFAGTHLLFGFSGDLHHFDSVSKGTSFTTSGLSSANGAAQAANGEIWYATFSASSSSVRKVNPATGDVTTVGASGQDIRALTFVGSTLYAICNNGASTDRLYTINQTTGLAILVGSTSHEAIQAMCTASNEIVYGWDVTSHHLVTINTATGASTNVRATVYTTSPIQSLDCDRFGVMWGVSSTGVYFRINRATGEIKPVQYGLGDIRGLVIPKHQGRLISLDLNHFASIDIATGRMVELFGAVPSDGSLATRPDGALWGVRFNKVSQIDPGNGVHSPLAPNVAAMPAMSYRNGIMYGITGTATQNLVSINTVTGTTTTIGSTGRPQLSINTLTTSANGTLYAYDSTLGLITVNPATGGITDVSAANGADSRIKAIEFGPDGTLYGGNTALFVLSPTTGLVTESLGGNAYTGVSALASMPSNGFYMGINANMEGGTFTIDPTIGAATPLGATLPVTSLTLTPEGTILSLRSTDVRTVDRSTGLLSSPIYSLTSALRFGMVIADGDDLTISNDSGTNDTMEHYDRVSGALISSITLNIGANINDLCANEDGSVFGWPNSLGLYQLDLTDGANTPVDSSPPVGVVTSNAFGPDGTLYASSAASFRRVDPTNGAATVIANLGFNCGGLVFTPPVTHGTIVLEDYDAPDSTQIVEVTLRHPGSTLALETHRPRVADDGSVRFASRLFGTYDVTIKGSHWLRRVVPNVLVTSGGTQYVNVHLTNGDCDGDNEVGIGDYSLLSGAFGSINGDPTWLPGADLNGDEAVDIGDYAILSASYAQVGDD